jgi:hypothetical protein
LNDAATNQAQPVTNTELDATAKNNIQRQHTVYGQQSISIPSALHVQHETDFLFQDSLSTSSS